MATDGQWVLSFGSGVRLVSENHYLEMLKPLGIGKRGFRSLCRALSVPLVLVRKQAFVDPTVFQVAIKYISSAGQPDFISSCLDHEAFSRAVEKKRRNYRPSVGDNELRANWSYVMGQILESKSMNRLMVTGAYRDSIKRAGNYLSEVAVSFTPSHVQRAYAQAKEAAEADDGE